MMSSFPLVSFLITLLLAAAVCTHGNEPVKDTAGNPVQVGEHYSIRPVKPISNGGGLYPDAVEGKTLCPLSIAQSLIWYQPGVPVSFKYRVPWIIDSTVYTSLPVNITFIYWPDSLWEVDDSSSLVSKEPAILIGGSRRSSNSSFNIEKAGEGAGENTYKLTALTGTVGITPGEVSGVHLVLTNDDAKTMLVQFKKVNSTSSTSRVDKLGLRMFPFY